jgi:hypothetical protein
MGRQTALFPDVNFDVIIDKTNGAETQDRQQADPGVQVPGIHPQEDRKSGGEDDHDPPHGWGSGLQGV